MEREDSRESICNAIASIFFIVQGSISMFNRLKALNLKKARARGNGM